MTSSGSGSEFLLRRGVEDLEGESRKRSVFDARRGGTSDEERQEVPDVGARSVMRRTVCVHAERA